MKQKNERQLEQESEFLRKAENVFKQLATMAKKDPAHRSLMIFAKDDKKYEGGNAQNVLCITGNSSNLVRLAAEIISDDEIGQLFTMASSLVKYPKKDQL